MGDDAGAEAEGDYRPGVILVRPRPCGCLRRCRRRRLWCPRCRLQFLFSLRCPAGPQVTGGAGFIGSHVVTRLVELYGYRVRRCCALQRRWFRRKA